MIEPSNHYADEVNKTTKVARHNQINSGTKLQDGLVAAI